MGLRFVGARAIAAVSTWGLKHLFHRPAANFPGKVALYIDPHLIAHLAPRLKKGSICVVGTNGKTTTTNLLADALELQGTDVVCNRTGANLDSGVATSLLQGNTSDWGVFECDELWLAKILPHLQSRYVLLLNLFRDQLDRVGEIERIQDSIANALKTSPHTTLVFNADDPLCASIAVRVANPTVAFGVNEDLHLPQNTVSDAQMCPQCDSMLEYEYRQYGQLGSYHCEKCEFGRPALDSFAHQVALGCRGFSFNVHGPVHNAHITAGFSGAYMLYNLLATWAASDLMGVDASTLQEAIGAFHPENGRLQEFKIEGYEVLLNLAKNPTGFNQNIRLVLQQDGPKAVAFFVNDKEADGRDISWLWDIDFEELGDASDLRAFAGGLRRNDVQVRLKYAGVSAELVHDVADVFRRLTADDSPTSRSVAIIANYTALPGVIEQLGELESSPSPALAVQEGTPKHAAGMIYHNQNNSAEQSDGTGIKESDRVAASDVRYDLRFQPEDARIETERLRKKDCTHPLIIAHLFPDLLNLYGDGGNVKILAERAARHEVEVDVRRINHGEHIDLHEVDLVFMGGGPDREQRLASQDLQAMRHDLQNFVEDDGVLLAICGGYQILGRAWLWGEELVEGLGILGITTTRAEGGSKNRLIGNIALKSSFAKHPVVGYENHAGRTHLDRGVQAFGRVISATGSGNNDTDHEDGVVYKGVVGTYLHGPLLAKNPEVADMLLQRAFARRSRRTGCEVPPAASLDDSVELTANRYMQKRLKLDVRNVI